MYHPRKMQESVLRKRSMVFRKLSTVIKVVLNIRYYFDMNNLDNFEFLYIVKKQQDLIINNLLIFDKYKNDKFKNHIIVKDSHNI
jgi:hypothetical protein